MNYDSAFRAFAAKKVFLFDFDGVLVDSLADIAASVNAALREAGFRELPEETLRGFVGDGARNLLLRAFSAAAEDGQKSLLTDIYIDERLSWYKAYYNAHAVERSALFPGVAEMLRAVKKAGLFAAVVSNKPLSTTRIIAEKLGIAEYLYALVGPENAGRIKPAPDGLATALRILNESGAAGGAGFTAADTLMTGDSPQDILAGKNFGCMTCAVLGGYTEREKLLAASPDACVTHAGELVKLFS